MADDDDDGFFSPPSYKRYALSGKIMLGAIIVLLFVVILMICLHLYVRLYLLSSNRRQAPRRRRHRRAHFVFTAEPRHAAAAAAPSRGLPQSILKSLPVFVHSAKPDPDPICCAVCLSEFEENEIGRIIPKCKHSFHVGCIDMWFYSHVTCPLCRSEVQPETGSDNPPDVSVSIHDPDIPEPGPSSGSTRSGEEPGCPSPSELPSLVELVVASSEESISEEGLRQIDDMSVHGTSRTTANFVKSLSFKRILCRDKRDGVSPSENATEERDLEKEEIEAARSVS
ncbi:RING-H2 finger protein ATL2-like [Momordica charantia]|uniref:RING-type E3 ubiquitin transferase n=1 Tax=Momordica charantia TaxID=3673 RepID=A0A6J1CAT0_MOMCH|nr:RING-H2 finger protein ATL2-like [Momordica charantia]